MVAAKNCCDGKSIYGKKINNNNSCELHVISYGGDNTNLPKLSKTFLDNHNRYHKNFFSTVVLYTYRDHESKGFFPKIISSKPA